jgi:hypothetical protein
MYQLAVLYRVEKFQRRRLCRHPFLDVLLLEVSEPYTHTHQMASWSYPGRLATNPVIDAQPADSTDLLTSAVWAYMRKK